jgi:ParB family transcriptional regulator, chromosome partitioning protein
MSPQAGWILQEEVVPRLRASIPRNVNYIGAEDAEELIQDATVMAAKLMHNVEQKGKSVTPGNIRVVKRLMDKRRFLGKQSRLEEPPPQSKVTTTADRMVLAYKRESQRQKELIRKARICEARLVFIVTAFNQLLASDPFVKLLEAEDLATMPQYLWSKLNHKPKEVV